ncbi:MAG TPA: cupin domain-containing protein, partial [Candidatus Eisenbacteria bacterium]|nr:cupin domain-containing protein [Candidatus Eisenbacteria bacterium]
VLRAMKTDPATARDPIKRMFLCDGQFITANASIIEDSGNALHTQPSHDEIVVILGGEADFRVGGPTRHVSARDMIFIPQNTLHGPIIPEGGRLELLSIFAPSANHSAGVDKRLHD